MIRITFRITYDWRIRLLFTALVVGLFLSGSAAPLGQPAMAWASPAETFFPRGGGRHFYLTEGNYSPSVALAVCASGYHMASLWEILDVSNLTYDYDHPAAHTQADSGYGPPSGWYGWVRTGFDSSNSSTAGTGNCLSWSTASGSDYGVSVRLSWTWETAPGDISTWDATSFTCNLIGPVWCAGDFYTVYLPLVLRTP